MSEPDSRMARSLKIAGILIILGLIVEVISLVWFHPLAFVLFAFVGGALIFIGMAVYLASLAFAGSSTAGDSHPS